MRMPPLLTVPCLWSNPPNTRNSRGHVCRWVNSQLPRIRTNDPGNQPKRAYNLNMIPWHTLLGGYDFLYGNVTVSLQIQTLPLLYHASVGEIKRKFPSIGEIWVAVQLWLFTQSRACFSLNYVTMYHRGLSSLVQGANSACLTGNDCISPRFPYRKNSALRGTKHTTV